LSDGWQDEHMADATLIELPGHIALALSMASASTGTDYSYLLKTAQRESSFQTDARASSSSATGLFQFIEETWIRTIKDEGERYGLKDYADRITRTEAGRYVIENPADRTAILALRNDARISALMAGVYAQRNAEMIANQIGRKPTAGELYIAHFMGPMDAIKLIQLRDTQPSLSAPDMFPRAAESNRTIFYALGHPLSVGAVYDRLVSRKSPSSVGPVAAAGKDVGGDFGSWKSSVERVYTVSAAGKTKAMLGSTSGFSLFDMLLGKPKPDVSQAAEATVAQTDVAVADATGWAVQAVNSGDTGTVPVKTPSVAVVAVPKPMTVTQASSTQKFVAKTAPANSQTGLAIIRGTVDGDAELAIAPIQSADTDTPRLKIIRVPARKTSPN
jgi:hypothetical protein